MTGSIYGYVRVSTREQNEDRQLIALREVGVSDKNIFMDMSIASITASVTRSLLAASTAKSHAGRSAAHSTASGPRLS